MISKMLFEHALGHRVHGPQFPDTQRTVILAFSLLKVEGITGACFPDPQSAKSHNRGYHNEACSSHSRIKPAFDVLIQRVQKVMPDFKTQHTAKIARLGPKTRYSCQIR